MQNSLFPDTDNADLRLSQPLVRPAAATSALLELGKSLPLNLHLGTSSWNYPGWAGLVWDKPYPAELLSRQGLNAYAQHPLFRTVGLDRSFYRPLTVPEFVELAQQVPSDFRFMVKAPASVSDALLRTEGKGQQINDGFLDAVAARRDFVEPALTGLGQKLGVLLFQISPLPGSWHGRIPELIERLHKLLSGLPELKAQAADAVVAVEVRDRQWLVPAFTQALKDTGATYCLGLHAKMPPIHEQLPILRALWPGPLVCRWHLNLRHGAFGYATARDLYAPYDKLADPDPETRAALARVIAGTVGAGQRAYVTLGNKAEGSSPLSVLALAEAVQELCNVQNPRD